MNILKLEMFLMSALHFSFDPLLTRQSGQNQIWLIRTEMFKKLITTDDNSS